MAAVFDATAYHHYLPMVDDNADDLEAQLHHELYGDDSLYAVPGIEQDDAQGTAGEDDDDAHDETGEETQAGPDAALHEEEQQHGPDTDPAGADNDEALEHLDVVTGYEERDAALLEDDQDADVAEDTTVPPVHVHQEVAPTFIPPTLQVPTSTDIFEAGTPASMAFADEPSEPTPMLIQLPGLAEPRHLCGSDEPAVLSSRKDLYTKTVAELFVALRLDPLLRDRFVGDLKEMTISIPELQLILHEDDPYAAEVRLEDLAIVHTAFCAPPVKFTLGEQHRFEYRFQVYQAEIQRRLEVNGNLLSTQPFDPELVSTAIAGFVPSAATTDVPAKVADIEQDMEEYEDEEEDEEGPADPEQLQPQNAEEGANVDEADYEEYYEEEVGDAAPSGQVDITQEGVPTTDDVGGEGRDDGNNAMNEPGLDDDAEGEDEGEEEGFIHVEAVDVAVDGDVIQAVVEEPGLSETQVYDVETEQVEYEYVDEDGNVLIEGYDSVTTHEPAIVSNGADNLDGHGEEPADDTNAEDVYDAPETGAGDWHEADGIEATQLDEFDLEAALESEYNKAAGSADTNGASSHQSHQLEQGAAFDDSVAQTTNDLAGPDNTEVHGVEAANDASFTVPHNTSNGGSPTSISGVKRAREDDIEDEENLLQSEVVADSHKRPRVA
ncbi:hypothetical protein CALCODRAFT_290454 [Calocera cornea HHB12733]|uniref:Uncharacterized protein n=1 Tax=Calocera cornea HHB12733 TaxID=1353952 RepID=A0A165FSP6_9BASI|nr:hypothetical protein CALCODRAFT_290454 [Calocera cornea HHB12733]